MNFKKMRLAEGYVGEERYVTAEIWSDDSKTSLRVTFFNELKIPAETNFAEESRFAAKAKKALLAAVISLQSGA